MQQKNRKNGNPAEKVDLGISSLACYIRTQLVSLQIDLGLFYKGRGGCE